jgi:hypothetical protein
MKNKLILILIFLNFFSLIFSVPYTFDIGNDRIGTSVIADGTKGKAKLQ